MIIEPMVEQQAGSMLQQDEHVFDYKPQWHTPQLTRIEIKKTLFICGSGMIGQTEDLYTGSGC
jgi:hypothetical protein